MKTINYGIDLGTTNSLIAKFENGKVTVFKNPVGFKETLPSCVAYRGERILIGDKARELITKDPLNVFSSFKRKMGTSEKYFVPTTLETVSPINLSSQVLLELKNFLSDNQKPNSVVITIPASFDTVQSNATKQAGYDAGFSEVVLLQEPIAASLAFFNANENQQKETGNWLVYDLGGGTFDAAIVSIIDNEMRVKDHQGDNYLGGVDFDFDIVQEIFVPQIVKKINIDNLSELITQRNGPYEKLYYILMLKAEEAKKELSNNEITDVDFSFTDENGTVHDIYFECHRADLEAILKPRIAQTIEMIQTMLVRNNLTPSQLEEIILIGGSTLIPLVRRTLESEFGIKINYSADPTNAVAVGAAYYAGGKISQVTTENKLPILDSEINSDLASKIKIAYTPQTKDREEYITATIAKPNEVAYYRIKRTDGGFDSGLKNAAEKIGEFVNLRENTVNEFSLQLIDAQHNIIYFNENPILITQGLRNLHGQPLPEDICIEVDDLLNNTTKCELVFERNSLLPLKKTIYKEVTRTLNRKSQDILVINLLEGNAKDHPNANKIVGLIEISAANLSNDLIRGTEVEITIEISESRDISVNVNLLFTNQEFKKIFNPTEKMVSISKLTEEVLYLQNEYNKTIMNAVLKDDFEKASVLQQGLEKLNELLDQIHHLKENDLTDIKYQIEERKRKIAADFYSDSALNSKLSESIEEYYQSKRNAEGWANYYSSMPENLKVEFKSVTENDSEVIKTQNYFALESLKRKLYKVIDKMIYQTPELTTSFFHHYASFPAEEYTDLSAAKKAIAMGEKALERQNYVELSVALRNLLHLTKNSEREILIKGTGIG